MFTLIIVIVSVALVVALVAATLYHGGDTATEGNKHAHVARLINEGEQMGAAFTFYAATTGEQASTTDQLLQSKTLKSVPVDWTIANGYATHAVETEDECVLANKKLALDTVPPCSDAKYADVAVCCQDSVQTGMGTPPDQALPETR